MIVQILSEPAANEVLRWRRFEAADWFSLKERGGFMGGGVLCGGGCVLSVLES